jgi:dihydroorotase-like cyclic amidohydrolase
MDDVYGPVDFLILEYPPTTDGKATAEALTALVDQGVVAIYDLMVVRKDADGAAHEVPLHEGAESLASFAAFAGARSGMLGGDDVDEAAKALEPGASAVVLLYENRWAVPFVAAARSEGFDMVASARLSAQQIMDTLDGLEAVS